MVALVGLGFIRFSPLLQYRTITCTNQLSQQSSSYHGQKRQRKERRWKRDSWTYIKAQTSHYLEEKDLEEANKGRESHRCAQREGDNPSHEPIFNGVPNFHSCQLRGVSECSSMGEWRWHLQKMTQVIRHKLRISMGQKISPKNDLCYLHTTRDVRSMINSVSFESPYTIENGKGSPITYQGWQLATWCIPLRMGIFCMGCSMHFLGSNLDLYG